MDVPKDIEDLIRNAFAWMDVPDKRDIAPHDCLECDELRRDFAGKPWESIESEVVERHVMALPLLSAEGKKYLLPLWLLRSINDPNSLFSDSLVFNLNSDHRWEPAEPYTSRQWDAIRATLQFLLAHADGFASEDVASALALVDLRADLSISGASAAI